VAALFGWEVAPSINNTHIRALLGQKNRSMLLAGKCQSRVKALNGLGRTAEEWIEALESLTLRKNLHLLTLLPWKDTFTHLHMLRRERAWCPICFQASAGSGLPVYEQLLWALQIITVCPRHLVRLMIQCPHCDNHNAILASRSRPGFCSTCNKWLGDARKEGQKEISKDELADQMWVAGQIGQIFSAAQALSTLPSKGNVAKTISRCVDVLAEGRNLKFSRIIGVPKDRVRLWSNGKNLPELTGLLKVCRAAKVTLLDALAGQVDVSREEVAQARVKQVTVGDSTRRRGHLPLNVSAMKRVLEESLRDEYPPPSLKEFALRHKRAPNTLRYRFPKLCKLAVAKYQKYRKNCKQPFYRKIKRSLNAALQASPVAPTLEDLVRKFKCHRSVFLSNFPDLCGALMKRNKVDRERQMSELERILQGAATDENPPRSLMNVSKKVSYSRAMLRNYFPTLCDKINERYRVYKQQQFELRRRELVQQVKHVAYSLYRDGIYPSVNSVQAHFNTVSIRSSEVALSALREVRLELNIESEWRLVNK
jgi:hypothetical protein